MAYALRAAEPAILGRLSGNSLKLIALTTRRHAKFDGPAIAFALINDRSAFDALEPEWNDLFRRAGRDTHLFQTFNWNWHWANHYLAAAAGERERRSLAVVTVRRHGRLAMVWPLMAERVAGLKVLRWMGEPVSQYGDVLAETAADTPELMRLVWNFITRTLGADAIFLRKVRADALVASLLNEQGLINTAVAEAPCLDLASAAGFAAYEEAHYSAKARKNRRRHMRRLAERGPVQILRHRGGPEARAAAMEAVALKSKWIKETNRVSLALADERLAAFFGAVAEGCGRPAGCEVSMLKSSGETVAIAVDISCGARRAAHIIVHNPRLDGFGPGMLLLQERLRVAAGEGVATFDLLAPAYAYKLDWADASVAVGDYALGISLSGRIFARVYLGFLRERIKVAAEARPHALVQLRYCAGRIGNACKHAARAVSGTFWPRRLNEGRAASAIPTEAR